MESRGAVQRRDNEKLQWDEDVHLKPQKRDYKDRLIYLTPLAFAPYFPLVRILFRKQPVIRDRLFFGGIAVAMVHGVYLMNRAQESSKDLK